jgi:hypothetical protein
MFLGLSRPLKKVPRNRLDMDGVPFGGMSGFHENLTQRGVGMHVAPNLCRG